MKIAVMGTGLVAQTITEKLTQLGHQIMMGSRDPEAVLARTDPDRYGRAPLREWLKHHITVSVGTIREAAEHAAVIINAMNGRGTLDALDLAGEENIAGKILLDIANPLDFSNGLPPTLTVCNTDSLGEQIQRKFKEAKVVKSLNTMNTALMVNPHLIDEDHHVFISGNDEIAKLKIRELLHSIGWKDRNIIDLGDITTARGTEQVLPIWVRLMTTLKTPMFNFKIVLAESMKKENGAA
jgi:8-hydroxy-5-deazaflavin:NADPH oxidoreductase